MLRREEQVRLPGFMKFFTHVLYQIRAMPRVRERMETSNVPEIGGNAARKELPKTTASRQFPHGRQNC
jgi:hypothetical protein